MKTWWKEAIIYQIYPRSFQDSNADGIGDLQGIISRLDYLQELGVDILWLSPIFASPNADNGYDVSDYQAIMTEFGHMGDFDQLLAQTHARGMKLIMDLVVNHSSDEHRWFQESRKSKYNPFRDYYIWKSPNPQTGGLPNDWISFFSGPAWDLDPQSGEYYLHLFAKKQPDLNWENPKLRQEIYDMMHFWLQKGVDGFRMDVIPFLSKDTTFGNYPPDRFADLTWYANGPRIHEFLKEMNDEVLSKYDCFTVGEGFGVMATQAELYVGDDRQELHSIYHFDHAVPREEECFLNPKPEFSLIDLKTIFKKWDTALQNTGWLGVYWGNHDNPRVLSRFGNVAKYRNESAKMLATVLLTLRGNPYIYQGDEIGMSNCPFDSIEEFDDIQVRNAYQTLVVEQGGSEEQFLKTANQIARDHARTPFQWDDSANAGFSDARRTWLKVNPNYNTINAAASRQDSNSIFSFYKQLIQLRKQTSALVYGQYKDLRPRCNRIYAYTRTHEGQVFLVMCNFKETQESFDLKIDIGNKSLILSNYPQIDEDLDPQKFTLRAFESRIYQLTYIHGNKR